MTGYLKRIVESEIDEFLGGLSAISIEGPKAVGKTETAMRRATTVRELDDRVQLEIFRSMPEKLLEGGTPILIDEWQRMPESWDIVRRSVDRDSTPGRFILTGSASPSEAPVHSGAGRIVTIRMRPLSLAERQIETPTVSLAGLLSGKKEAVEGETSLTVVDYANEIVKSGFPGIRSLTERLARAQMAGYIDRIVGHDFDAAGHSVRDPEALRSWLRAYAAASSTTASFETIRDTASAGLDNAPAKSTVMPYRNVLKQIWLIEPVPAWLPTSNHLRRLGASPVHQLTDPAIAAELLGVGVEGLIDGKVAKGFRDGPLLGSLFESLVTLSVRTYAQANEAKVRHLRTRGGEREIDLIIERRDGRVVAVEVKLTARPRDADVGNLKWLQERLGDDLLDAVVITTGSYAYRRPDGIAVIPAALLKE